MEYRAVAEADGRVRLGEKIGSISPSRLKSRAATIGTGEQFSIHFSSSGPKYSKNAKKLI